MVRFKIVVLLFSIYNICAATNKTEQIGHQKSCEMLPKYLNCSYRELTMCAWPSYSSVLDTVDLSYNEISNITINETVPIQQLYLQFNNIEVVETISFIRFLPRLLYLDLSHNSIKTIFAGVGGVGPPIEHLDLSYNNLTSAGNFTSWQELSTLKLGFNFIREVDFVYFPAESLSFLDLRDNPMEGISLPDDTMDFRIKELRLWNVSGLQRCSFLKHLSMVWLNRGFDDFNISCAPGKWGQKCVDTYITSKLSPETISPERVCSNIQLGKDSIDPFIYFFIVLGALLFLVSAVKIGEITEAKLRQRRFLNQPDSLQTYFANIREQFETFEAATSDESRKQRPFATRCEIIKGKNGEFKMKARLDGYAQPTEDESTDLFSARSDLRKTGVSSDGESVEGESSGSCYDNKHRALVHSSSSHV